MLSPGPAAVGPATADRPDVVVAISKTVQERIRRFGVATPRSSTRRSTSTRSRCPTRDDGYLLIAARMLAYRRIDLAVQAATRLGRELVLVGDGPERKRLEAIAGPTVGSWATSTARRSST